ncbi:MAG TPA: alkaline phosphatase family protein [Acidimicrobiales bacterium]|nr:alkaline phosphatase family protein [Acidimicrobiales bacterium]
MSSPSIVSRLLVALRGVASVRWSRWRRAAIAVPSLFLIALLGLGLPRMTNAMASTPASTLGIYSGSFNVSEANNVSSQVGYHIPYAMDFFDGSSWSTISNPNSTYFSSWNGTGYKMIWGVDMLPNSGASLATGATGAYDQYFVTLAQNLVANGQGNSIIRLGWEFNGSWFPWAAGGQAGNFVTYWQHIVNAMRSVSGQSFQFEWNPTRGDMGVGDLATYYPGDAYVDIIGLDVYDVEWNNYPGYQQEWSNMQTQTFGLDWLASFAGQHNKTISFPEWGLGWGVSSPNSGPATASNGPASGGDNPYFIDEMSSWIASHNVSHATYWDYGISALSSNPMTDNELPKAFPASGASGGSTGGGTTSSGSTSGGSTSGSTTTPSVPNFDHIFTIMMENHGYSSIIGSSSAPYINSLASKYGTATNYFAVEHPSLPNYLDITGGQNFENQQPNIANDCLNETSAQCQVSGTNIADEVVSSGRSWKAYMESMPSNCYVSDSGEYAVRHNPFVYYQDIQTTSQCNKDVPYTQLATDLQSASTTPNYVWVTPNLIDDMHDGTIAQGDSWLSQNVPAILNSPAFTQQKSLLMIAFDEDEDTGGTNQVPMIVIQSGGGHTASGTQYNHFSTLKTIETAWGLPSLTSNDGNASAMTDFFPTSSTGTTTPAKLGRAAGFPVDTWNNSGNVTSQSLTTAKVGDLELVSVEGTVPVTSVSGGGVSSWSAVPGATFADSAYPSNWTTYEGVVTAAGAQTLKIAWNGTSSGSEVFTDELGSSDISSPTWSVVASGHQANDTATTTITYPKLASGSASEQAYWGATVDANVAGQGSNSGFSYTTDANGNAVVLNPALAASTSYQPTEVENVAGASNTVGVIVSATAGTSGGTTSGSGGTTSPDTITVKTTSLPSGTVGQAYSATLTATSSSGATIRWQTTDSSGKVISMANPAPGLNWSGNLTISGTPTTAGTYTLYFKVSDSTGASTNVKYSLVIGAKTH